MRSFSIQSFGCRVNQAEAFQWADEFQKHGLNYEEDFIKSDLVLINTCTLTAQADRDVRKFIRRIARDNPGAKLVVAGCYVDRTKHSLKGIPQIWQIIPNRDKKDLPEGILTMISPQTEGFSFPYRSRALIKIQDGCDYRCSFCVIPGVRGGSLSTEKKEILDQMKRLIDRGFKEIVLTGIHIGLYGRDLEPQDSLLDLLKSIEGLRGLGRIRLSSLDPRFMDQALLEHLVASEKICPHFHLSLQHGSDRVIKRMGRNIKTSDYAKILDFLRREAPASSLGTDIIVGFPGETDDDFYDTYRFLEESPLTYLHVFTYSPRPDTAAASWKQIRPDVKKERAQILRRMSRRKNYEFRKLFVEKERQAVVIKREPDRIRVLTDNYIEVRVSTCIQDEGKELKVKVTRVSPSMTEGISMS